MLYACWFLGPTFCFGLTRANTCMWGKRAWNSWGSQLSLASPSPVTHKSNWRTKEETEVGGSGTRTLPSMDSHCHSPGKQITSEVNDSVLCLCPWPKHPLQITTRIFSYNLYYWHRYPLANLSITCNSVKWRLFLTLTRAWLQNKCVFFLDEVELSCYMARR